MTTPPAQANEPPQIHIHPSAVVDAGAEIGAGTRVWHWCHVRQGARIGAECVLGKGVYVDSGVVIGNRVKLQNGVSVFDGVTVEDGVFIGPHVCFTNDKTPRAINPDGSLKQPQDWVVTPTQIGYGAAIGAGSVIVCGITIGQFAMIAAGAVVTHDVPAYGLVAGVPARLLGYVCPCGQRLDLDGAPHDDRVVAGHCAACGRTTTIGT